MNVGKTLFAQVMEYVPCKTFGRIIQRYAGDAGVRTLDCADLFRVMAFSQLTWRESLRDIEVCLQGNHAKLFHMGFSGASNNSTSTSRSASISTRRSTRSMPPPSTCA